MFTLAEVTDLRNKLINQEISLVYASKLYWENHDKNSRSWHSKDWKNRRKEWIKDQCQICQSREHLVVQHLSHPRSFKELRNETIKKYVDLNVNIHDSEFIDYIQDKYEYQPRDLCPNCHNRNPNKRLSKLPIYLCTKCKHEFNKPAHLTISDLIILLDEAPENLNTKDKCFVSKDSYQNKHNISNIKYWLLRNRSQNDHYQSIELEIFISYLNDVIKYLSFEDAITACRECAANFDLNKMDLCSICKKNYKKIDYQTCIDCLPEDTRNRILLQREFNKQQAEISKDLGID